MAVDIKAPNWPLLDIAQHTLLQKKFLLNKRVS